MKFRVGNSSSRIGNANSSAGGGCLIAFGLIFGCAGLAGFIFLSKLALDEAATYQWTETPCAVESCEIEDDVSNEDPFTMVVRYGYGFGGQRFTSSQYTLQDSRYDSYEKLALKRKALLSAPAVCYVNPEDPATAVIHREGIMTGLFALFPLIFVVVGGGIVWAGIHTLRKKKATKAGGGVESISSEAKAKGAAAWKVGAAFGAVFFLVGAGMLYPLAIRPISKMLKSEHWMETPCKIIWSTVRRHESTDSDGHTSVTYSVDIFYEYEFNGETHRSNNYGFFGGSSSGRGGKQKVVSQYRKGSEQKCYVNPDLPEQAVLKSGLSVSALFGLIPAAFVVIGALVAFGSIRSGRKKKRGGSAGRDRNRGRDDFQNQLTASRSSAAATASALRTDSGISDHGTGPRILKPAGSRLTKTLVILGIALFWNGIVSVFVYQVVQGFRRGDPEWFLTIFMIPFVLVGLGLLIGFFYQLLALANPKPVVTLNPGTVRLGEAFDLRWELKGSASRLTSLKLSIWGIESATYRRGTNTHTSNETFYADAFAETSRLMGMRSGAASVTIPGDLMYSFGSGNNQIKYELRIEGDIPFWPDIGDHYEITVLPHRPQS